MFPSPAALRDLQGFSVELQDEPREPATVLEELDLLGSPATVASTGGRYFGFVTGGALPARSPRTCWPVPGTRTRDWSSARRSTCISRKSAAAGSSSLLGLPAQTEVGFVDRRDDGELHRPRSRAARGAARAGWDVEAQGLFGAPPITVIVGDEVHVSVLKALGMLGLGRERVVRVPADGQGRMIATQLPPIDGPTIVCTQAGNVNTGAFDPIGEIAARLRGTGAWIHVDGAFGLWAAAAPAKRALAAGVDLADSLATDAHKWLNVPYDSGLVFVRDRRALNAAMSASAAYLIEARRATRICSFRRCRAARARSKSGPRCARWAGAGSRS